MRVLGIDLGTYSIKAVEVESSFSKFDIRDTYEQKVPDGLSPFETAAQLVNHLPRSPDRIVVALPTSQTTFRNFEFSTKDKRAIQSGVQFELEDELPIPIENAVFDHFVRKVEGNTSHVYACSALKKNFEEFLGACQKHGIDPEVVTTEPWAMHVMAHHTLPEPEKTVPILVIHVGHKRTVIYAEKNGQNILSRELAFGSTELTEALSIKYGMNSAMAEEAKQKNGFVLATSKRAEHSRDQQLFSDTLMEVIRPFLRELKQITLAVKSQCEQPVMMIYVSGGGSHLPGLDQVIEEEIQVPVKHLASLSLVSNSVNYSEHSDKVNSVACGLALSTVAPFKTQSINLRRGLYLKKSVRGELNSHLIKRVALGCAVVLVCMTISLIAQTIHYKSQMVKVDKALERSLAQYFPDKTPKDLKSYLSNPQKLRSELQAQERKRKELLTLADRNPKLPLVYLRDISQRIQPRLSVDLITFQMSAPTHQAGVAESFDSIKGHDVNLVFLLKDTKPLEELKTILSASLKNFAITAPEEAMAIDGKQKRIRVTVTGRLEAPYGVR